MVTQADLQERVREWGLREEVVEKDYVLGWVLACIGDHPRLRDSWVFKGGTCLKKCYFETYRFSEDLDFTVIRDGPRSPEELLAAFREIASRVYEESGIEVPPDQLRFDSYTNPAGRTSVQGRLYYRGPRQTRGDLPRIKLDITADEVLVRPPVRLAISHEYPDTLPGDGTVLAYSYTEIFAEKIRALAERSRPRDLYDVIHLMRHPEGMPSPGELHDVLFQKCAFKGLRVPTLESLQTPEVRAELDAEWANMLAHQLSNLPPVEPFWGELPGLFAWLAGATTAVELPRIAAAAGEDTAWAPPRAASVWHAAVPLEAIRFAAANRLCVDLQYQGSWRVIEPYSLRRSRDGNLLLYAIRADTRETRCYRVDRIQGVNPTQRSFTPVYRVELTAGGPLAVSPTARPRSPAGISWGVPRSTTSRSSRRHGLTYIIECPVCEKRFTRSRRDFRLNAHKDKDGHNCYGRGRTGRLIDTRWD
jgi:predicted nucleotidyltransferase component of viral defense system